MTYTASSMSERMKRVKDTYMSLTVPTTKDPYNPPKYKCYCSGDRLLSLGYMRGYANHRDALTKRLRISYAEAQELYESKPAIYDDELLLGHLYLPDYTDAEWDEYNELYEKLKFAIAPDIFATARRDHICLDFEKLLRVGVNGLKAEINQRLSTVDRSAKGFFSDMSAVKKCEFYNCCLIELEAVSDLARRYSKLALKLSEEKCEPRRSELIRLSGILKKVPDEPASNFYEAIQSVQFFLSTLFGLFPLGRPDRYLYPYYEKDIKEGKITREFAQELVDNFCLYVSDRVFTRSACGFIVGGYGPDGALVENDLTYMFITALDHLKLPDPNGALAVNKDTSEALLAYSAEVISHGPSHPAFYNDEAIINSLVNNYSVPYSDAANYIHSTCAEISIIGKSKAYSTPFQVDLPRILDDVVRSCEFDSLESIIAAYAERIKAITNEELWKYTTKILEATRHGNDAMRISALIDDCLERGMSLYEGGARYSYIQPIFVGFATAVDSLYAIGELVYGQKRLTLSEFSRIVYENFDKNESLRQYIINKIPHYGNSDGRVDHIAHRLSEEIRKITEADDACFGENLMPGTFSYINHATLGEQMGATFDGRVAYTSYSDGCSAVQGRDTNGPTAMIVSLTSWEQSWLLGGMVVNMKFSKEHLNANNSCNFVGVVRTFMERGGIELQVNVVDRATLEDAYINPDAHRDLIVRIGGYSDYFVRLRPSLQREIISRTEY